jgi:4'-phosphopantetheinyl transferase EntD
VIDELLPCAVSAAETFADVPGVVLFPAEDAALRQSVDKRRREFATARSCARKALAGLGIGPLAVVPGLRGAPDWPAGIVGSITHCDGYRAAAVAHRTDIVTIGVDAEPVGPLIDGVLEAVTLDEERARLRVLAARRPDVHWDRLIFSAKEAVYKAWFPLTLRWLGFEDVAITVDDGDGTFRAELRVPGPVVGGRALSGLDGRWLVRDGLTITAIALPAPHAVTRPG